jgi:hypothetical protein
MFFLMSCIFLYFLRSFIFYFIFPLFLSILIKLNSIVAISYLKTPRHPAVGTVWGLQVLTYFDVRSREQSEMTEQIQEEVPSRRRVQRVTTETVCCSDFGIIARRIFLNEIIFNQPLNISVRSLFVKCSTTLSVTGLYSLEW